MKVFDFTNGTKGEFLAEAKVVQHTGGWLVQKNGSTFKVKLTGSHGGPDDRWSWVSNAGHTINGENVNIRPEDFGVEAVCFCIGEIFHQWHPGHPEAESHWCWHVIGTTEWNRNACKAGVLKATKHA